MPFTPAEKQAIKARNDLMEGLHQHAFRGTPPNCAECGKSPGDFWHIWVPPVAQANISEAEALSMQARSQDQESVYKHHFQLCEETGNCRECQLPASDTLHDAVKGTAAIIRTEDL